MTRRTRAALAVGLLVMLLAAAPGSALSALQLTGRTQFLLASAGSDGVPAGADSGQPALAANGAYTAFVSPATLNVGASVPQGPGLGSFEPTRVYVRGRLTGTTTLLSDPASVEASAPTISGDGRLVAYDGVSFFNNARQIYVVNRQATGRGAFDTSANLAVTPVTGNAGDPHYQRITFCPFFSETGIQSGCGPQLSADGSTLAYPAQLSPVAPTLGLSVNGQSPSANLVDFVPPGTMTLGGASVGTFSLTLRYTNFGSTPIQLIGPPVVTGPFQLAGFTCDPPPTAGIAHAVQTLAPDQSCSATVVFDAGQSCPGNGQTVVRTGDIVTDATTPDGQSDHELLATCAASGGTSSFPTGPPTTTPPPTCAPEPAGLSAQPAPEVDSDNQNTPLVDFGQSEVGQPVLEWVPVSGIGQVSFQANDCSVQFVGPPAVPPAGLPPACQPGQELGTVDESGQEVAGSCTGYFLVTPQDVHTSAALLTVGGSGNVQPTYLSVTGVRSVVVTRHGPNFAVSPGIVISVDGNGNPIPGASSPSLSATGRYVAFSAQNQVWRHDTDRAGDGNGVPGATNLASCLPGPGCQLAAAAGSPSISGDGSSIAFATLPAGSTLGQVYVRRTTTVLVSGPGNASSQNPALSQDGSTVAFTSSATNLVAPPTSSGAQNLYLVNLGPGTAGIELVVPNGIRLGADGVVDAPSIDAHGRVVAMESNTPFVPNAPAEVSSTYTFERFGQLQANPGSVGFGRLIAGLPGQTRTVTVTDTGPGPATITAIAITGVFRLTLNTCLAVVLHFGQTCQLTVLLTPTAAGAPTGVLTLTTVDDGDPPGRTTIGLSATVVVPTTPVLTLSPTVSYGGQVVRATGIAFPVGSVVTLAWNRGLGATTVNTDANGGFHVDVVIFPDDLLGTRALIATGPTGTMLATAPFLVEANPQEPPFHHP